MNDITHDALVEKVARAIYLRRYEHQGGVWDAVEPRYQRDVWGADARAALAAIREAAGLDDAALRREADWHSSSFDGAGARVRALLRALAGGDA